jgi:hypothetical protein
MLRYIRAHPFSTMALCNIVGDLCYLGFAFDAEGFVSVPKLIGASFTLVAHIVLLAYGDDQARAIAIEAGRLARIFFFLRQQAQRLTHLLPALIQKAVRHKPVGIPFMMLSVNGAAFIIDGLLRLHHHASIAMWDQTIQGVLVGVGTALFAFADFSKKQSTANFLTKCAPSVLGCASVANGILALTTRNDFVIVSFFAFVLSNIAGFYTHISKEKGQHLRS